MYDNYETDSRVRAAHSGNFYKSIGKSTLTVVIYDDEKDEETDVEFPFKWEVCPLCNGKGSHVNPSIDCNGLTAEDFYEDPDLAEDYFSGMYDQQCNQCHGRTTVPVIDEDRCNKEQKEWLAMLRENQKADAEYQQICAWERRMGC